MDFEKPDNDSAMTYFLKCSYMVPSTGIHQLQGYLSTCGVRAFRSAIYQKEASVPLKNIGHFEQPDESTGKKFLYDAQPKLSIIYPK